MEYITYNEAVSFLEGSSSKIKAVIFALNGCTTCDDFVPDILEVELGSREDFEYVKVDLAKAATSMKFPPVSAPTTFFFIPNAAENMTLFRVGGTTPQILKNDLDAMVRIKNESLSLEDAFAGVNVGEVTQWVQRGLPL